MEHGRFSVLRLSAVPHCAHHCRLLMGWDGMRAGFFLKKFRGAHCGLNDLPTLDPQLHSNLLKLRHHDGDVADLALTFALTETVFGAHKEVGGAGQRGGRGGRRGADVQHAGTRGGHADGSSSSMCRSCQPCFGHFTSAPAEKA